MTELSDSEKGPAGLDVTKGHLNIIRYNLVWVVEVLGFLEHLLVN